MNMKLVNYLSSLLPESEQWVTEMEQRAKEDFIPIMDPLAMHFLMQIIRMTKPQHILEIGTAIGYSTLRMSEAYSDAKIITIERNRDHMKEAINQINKHNKKDTIHVLQGEAVTHMDHLANEQMKFNLIFIDAAKSKYKQFFQKAIPLLSKDGIIVTDNVLFKGYVYNDGQAHRRHQKLANKIDSFNHWLAKHPQFHTSLVPIGDGIAMSMKKFRKR